nr:PREDICTED: LOW QUALITY PROTEIN: taste receptor type 2 member 4 [Camelus bactrianus]
MRQAFFFSSLIISAIVTSAGVIANLFIAVINYKNWVKSHKISSSDRILFSLGITRVLILGLSTIFSISSSIRRSVSISTYFLSCWLFLDSNSLWFVTLLNALYCLSPKMPRLLLACVLISAFTTLLHVVLREASRSLELVTGRNGTVCDVNEEIFLLVSPWLLSSCLQFSLNVTSASLLINSLRRHIQKMQRSATALWTPQTEAHVGAMKLMICFLILYVPYSVASLLHYLPSVASDLRLKSIYIIISTFYPPAHSVLIILTHPKLKTKAKKILHFNK